MAETIKAHRHHRSEEEAALEAAEAHADGGANAVPPPAPQLTAKQAAAEEQLSSTIGFCVDAIEKEPAAEGVPQLRAFARIFNSTVRKEFRGRTGKQHRFMDAGMREVVPDGERPSNVPQRPPLLQLLECPNVIRLCRRLMGGGSAANLAHAASDLGVEHAPGESAACVRTRVELKLRALDFETYDEFVPTAAHLRLPLDEFNARLTSDSIPLLSFDQRAGADGAVGSAYRETPWSEVKNMSQVLAGFRSERSPSA
jgi:hypothetical protein